MIIYYIQSKAPSISAIARALEDWQTRKDAGELGEGADKPEEEDIYAVKHDVEVRRCFSDRLNCK